MRHALIASFCVLAMVAALGWSAPASACSPLCNVELAPQGTSASPARLPANGAFVAVPGGGSYVVTATLARTRAGVTQTIMLAIDGPIVAIPDAQPDDQLVVSAQLSCGGLPMTNTSVIEITPSAPVPTTLGVLDVDPSHAAAVAVWDNRGGCASDLRSTVAPYALALDSALDPWADALALQPMLDGVAWNETPDARVAPHFVFAHCEPLLPSQTAYDTTPGEHQLRIDGTLRGLTGTIASNEVAFELTCGAAGSGCAVVPPDGAGSVWLAALAVLALVLAVRRRRT